MPGVTLGYSRKCVKEAVVFVLFLILTLTNLPVISEQTSDEEFKPVIHVGPGYPVQHIQTAIDLGDDGTTIMIHQGIYRESIEISKSVKIMAYPGETYEIRPELITRSGHRTRGDIFKVTKDGAEISGGIFSCIDTTLNGSAIKVQAGVGVKIHHNVFIDSIQGIWIHGGDDVTDLGVDDVYIHNNTITNVSLHGIYLQRTWGIVENNNISNCGDGIMVAFDWTSKGKTEGRISNNIIENCSTGVNLVESHVYNYRDNEIKNCHIGEKFNSTELYEFQTSYSNNFSSCAIGSQAVQTAGPYISSNIYDGCGISIQTLGSDIRLRDVISYNTTQCAVSISDGRADVLKLESRGGRAGIDLRRSRGSLINDAELSGTGDYGILLENSDNTKIYGTEMTGFFEGILPIWNDIEHLDHTIPENNTIDGAPIFYSYGDRGVNRTISEKGQIIIANSSSSRYLMTSDAKHLTRLLHSSDADISGSKFSSGLMVFGSDKIAGEDVELETSPMIGSALHMDSSTCSFYNSAINGPSPAETAISLDSGSTLDLYSCDIWGSESLKDYPSSLNHHFNIGLEVLHEEGLDPVQDAEYEIEVDGSIVHATPLFDGADEITGQDGRAGPFWILNRTNRVAGMRYYDTAVRINASMDREWEGTFQLDTSEDHFERIVIGDIRRPSIPQNLQGSAVPERDVIGLQWDPNEDDTVGYRIYMKIEGEWGFLSETNMTTYEHMGTPHDTIGMFRITAVDDAGLESLPSAEIEVLSQDMLPPKPPRSLKVDSLTDDGMIISWTRSVSPDVAAYEVYLVEEGSEGELEPITLITTTKDLNARIIDDIWSENRYSVRAVDEAGKVSTFCEPVTLTASDLTWPEIDDLAWIAGASQATISFTTSEPAASILWFGSSAIDLTAIGPGELMTEHTYDLEDLHLNTTYYFYVFAIEPSGNNVTDDNNGTLYSFRTISVECYLNVNVVDEDGEPISGVEVLAERMGIVTNVVEGEEGVYRSFLTPGIWTINVGSTDHQPAEPLEILIRKNETKNVSFTLWSREWDRVNLTIHIIDIQGQALLDAKVSIDGAEYRTGLDGNVRIMDLEPGDAYEVTIDAEGLGKKTMEVPISAKNREQRVDITMEPGEGDDGVGADEGPGTNYLILLLPLVLLILIIFVVLFLVRKRSGSKEKEVKRQQEKKKGGKTAEKDVQKGVIEESSEE